MARPAEDNPEITSEMIEAGLEAYYSRNEDIESGEDIVARIYRVMRQADHSKGTRTALGSVQ